MVSIKQKAHLKGLGLWAKYVERREELKEEGVEWADDVAYEEMVKGGEPTVELMEGMSLEEEAEVRAKKRGRRKGRVVDGLSDLLVCIPEMPSIVRGRSASEAENIRWIYNHIQPGTDLNDCPSPGAWTEVHVCRMDAQYMIDFLKGPRTRLVPTKLDDGKDAALQDGHITLGFLKKMREYRAARGGLKKRDDEELEVITAEGFVGDGGIVDLTDDGCIGGCGSGGG